MIIISVGFKSPLGASEFLEAYNASAEEYYYNAVIAEWNYNTDINEETQTVSVSWRFDYFRRSKMLRTIKKARGLQ